MFEGLLMENFSKTSLVGIIIIGTFIIYGICAFLFSRTVYVLTDPLIPDYEKGDVDDFGCLFGLVSLSRRIFSLRKYSIVICDQARFYLFKENMIGGKLNSFCKSPFSRMNMIGESDFLSIRLESNSLFLVHSPIDWKTLQKMMKSRIPPMNVYFQGNSKFDWNVKHTLENISDCECPDELQESLKCYLDQIIKNSHSSPTTGGCQINFRELSKSPIKDSFMNLCADKSVSMSLGIDSIPSFLDINTFFCGCLERDPEGKYVGNPLYPETLSFLEGFYEKHNIPLTGYNTGKVGVFSKGNTTNAFMNTIIYSNGKEYLEQAEEYLTKHNLLFENGLLTDSDFNRKRWSEVTSLISTRFSDPGAQKLFTLVVIINIMIFGDWVILSAIPGKFLSKDDIPQAKYQYDDNLHRVVYRDLSPPMWDLGNMLLVLTPIKKWTNCFMHPQMDEAAGLVNQGIQILMRY